MFIAKDRYGKTICAHCGCHCIPTKDHYIPKSSGMTVNEEGNYVGLCLACNREKGHRIVLPEWYPYLKEFERRILLKYFRYAAVYVKNNTDDKDVLDFLKSIEEE